MSGAGILGKGDFGGGGLGCQLRLHSVCTSEQLWADFRTLGPLPGDPEGERGE